MLVLAAGLVAGCGSDDEQGGEPIPAQQAAALERQLESIENRFQFGGSACADITGNADPNTTAVASVIDSLPENVDPDVRSALQQSFDRLFQLVEEQCDTEKGQEEQPAPAEPEPTPTIPPEEEPDTTEEETPPPTEEVPTTPEAPPEEVPPEVPPGQEGNGDTGQGESGGSGQENGAADQGTGGGAIVPEAGQ